MQNSPYSTIPKQCQYCGAYGLKVGRSLTTCSKCTQYEYKTKLSEKIMWYCIKHEWKINIFWFLLSLWMLVYVVQDPIRTGYRHTPWGLIAFGTHESGHLLFIPMGEFMTILGGSLMQLIFPLLITLMLAWRKAYFLGSLSLVWLTYNMYDVSVYAADARSRSLDLIPLFGTGDDMREFHDWYQILKRLGRLEQDLMISNLIRYFGLIMGIIGLAIALAMLIGMAYFRKKCRDFSALSKADNLYKIPTINNQNK